MQRQADLSIWTLSLYSAVTSQFRQITGFSFQRPVVMNREAFSESNYGIHTTFFFTLSTVQVKNTILHKSLNFVSWWSKSPSWVTPVHSKFILWQDLVLCVLPLDYAWSSWQNFSCSETVSEKIVRELCRLFLFLRKK